LRSFSLLILPALILAVSFTILYPNFAERTLNLAVQNEVYNLDKENQDKLSKAFFDKWQKDYGLTSK